MAMKYGALVGGAIGAFVLASFTVIEALGVPVHAAIGGALGAWLGAMTKF